MHGLERRRRANLSSSPTHERIFFAVLFTPRDTQRPVFKSQNSSPYFMLRPADHALMLFKYRILARGWRSVKTATERHALINLRFIYSEPRTSTEYLYESTRRRPAVDFIDARTALRYAQRADGDYSAFTSDPYMFRSPTYYNFYYAYFCPHHIMCAHRGRLGLQARGVARRDGRRSAHPHARVVPTIVA